MPAWPACLATDLASSLFFVEFLLRWLFYGDLHDMAPASSAPGGGIFDATPVLNSRIFGLVREKRASWLRGDIERFTSTGIQFSRRSHDTTAGDPGVLGVEQGDVCILATGFKRPSLSFLPKSCSDGVYSDPNWFLTVFPTTSPTVCAINATFRNGIASAGGAHIGIYARMLLVFLLDPSTLPSEYAMKSWVDLCHFIKKTHIGGAFAHVTAGEMHFATLATIFFTPSLWTWSSFILNRPNTLRPSPPIEDLTNEAVFKDPFFCSAAHLSQAEVGLM
jgi:hypothetical protein